MKKQLILLVISAIVLLATLGAYVFWYSIVIAKSTEANTLASQIATQSNASAQAAQAKTVIAQLATQESTIDQYFVSTSQVVPFLEQLQSIGKFLGAKVQVVSVAAVPGTPYGHLDLALSITGPFDAVSRTVGAIEYGPYDSSISTFSLNTSVAPGDISSSSPQWTANATFSIGAQTGTASSTKP